MIKQQGGMMTYSRMAQIRHDSWMRERVVACAAALGVPTPESWASENAWQLATQPGWADAWGSALVENPDPEYQPGRDEAVITDGMILAAVTALHTELGD